VKLVSLERISKNATGTYFIETYFCRLSETICYNNTWRVSFIISIISLLIQYTFIEDYNAEHKEEETKKKMAISIY
jgi:hypothetical protein